MSTKNSDIREIFIDRLNTYMELKRLGPNALAEITGFSNASISRWISGKVSPKLDDIIIIADALDVPIEYLFKRKNVKLDETLTDQELFENIQLSIDELRYRNKRN